MLIHPRVRIVTLLVIAAFSHFTKATAQARKKLGPGASVEAVVKEALRTAN